MAMLRERPVARLSAALEGTKPNSSAAAETFSFVLGETEPRPDSALEAVDFDTPARFATSASVLTRLTLVRKFAEHGGFEPRRLRPTFFPRHVSPVRGRIIEPSGPLSGLIVWKLERTSRQLLRYLRELGGSQLPQGMSGSRSDFD